MIDLGDLLEGLGTTRQPGPRGQRIGRLVFGLLLGALAFAGAYQVATTDAGGAFRLAGVVMFTTLGLFGVFGLALGVGVRLFGCLAVLSFVALFAVRILFGA